MVVRLNTPYIVVFIFVILLTGCSNGPDPISVTSSTSKPPKQSTIIFSNAEFNIKIASTDKERVQGLSGTKNLNSNQGLLFDFKEDAKHGIWMKDMNYSIDILWLDQICKVVHIEESISPGTYPTVFYSEQPARYVLEIKAGLTSKFEIQVGDNCEIVLS